MPIEDIVLLLEFCLKNKYFSFKDQFCEQVEGAPMCSPVSPIVANLYMDHFEQKALSTASSLLGSGAGMWMILLSFKRKKIKTTSSKSLTSLIWPFSLESKTIRKMVPLPSRILTDGKLSMTVYRKPTHKQTSIYSGTATIISQPNIVSLVPSPIGPKQYLAIQSFCKKKCSILGKLLPIVTT